MENRKKVLLNFLKLFIMGSIVFFLYLNLVINNYTSGKSMIIVTLFLFIGISSFYMMIKSISIFPYSLNMMHWCFCFVFFGISGYLQYISNGFIYNLQITESQIIHVLLIIILWMIFFQMGKLSSRKIFEINDIVKVKDLISITLNSNYAFVVFSTITSITITLYIIIKVGFSSILSRSTEISAFIQDTQAGSLVISSLMKYLIVYGLAISIFYYKKNKKGLFLIIVQFICCLVVNSPIGMSRFNVAIIYIGLLLIAFDGFKRNKSFIFVFLIGFVLLFPMINVFRHASLYDVSIDLILATVDDVTENFLIGDYDAFSMIVNTLNYIKDYGITYGYQFLGPILFFIPRSIWPTKPFGSGHTVREAQGELFTNVSSPFIAEALINFGVLGVAIFAFFIGKTISHIDKLYWNYEKKNSKFGTYIQILYPFLLSMFFFMNRGDLLSTISFAIGHMAILTLMFWLNNALFSKLRL